MTEMILGLITISAKIFSDERRRYFEKEVKSLQDSIHEVADSDFYNKDMEAKGLAERELERRRDALAQEILREGNK